MPHIVLDGEIDLEAWAFGLEPMLIREGSDVLRLDHVFVEGRSRQVLLEALVVEAGRKQSFYIKVSRHEGRGATVRIDPLTRPERSPAVRRLVAEVGASLLRRFPDVRVERATVVIPSGAVQGGGSKHEDRE